VINEVLFENSAVQYAIVKVWYRVHATNTNAVYNTAILSEPCVTTDNLEWSLNVIAATENLTERLYGDNVGPTEK